METIPKEEVLSLEDGEFRTIYITGYLVKLVHFPKYSDPTWDRIIPARNFRALKITISAENEIPTRRHYWIDSKRLIGVLLPLLQQLDGTPRKYLIVKHGLPPKSAYEVSAI